tara:strand:+ start:343 stop:543 length:201 start_codon:yes stop_codon:yes gene_type:complete
MIPIIAGLWYLVVALASIQAYQTSKEAWDAYQGAEEVYEDAKSGIGGIALIAGGVILLALLSGRRK